MEPRSCFGILDRVFPLGDRGLREVPPGCFECPARVPCLRAALDTREGIEARADALERQPSGGFLEGLRRWSRKKELSRLMEERKGKGK